MQGGDSVTPEDGYLGTSLHITASTGSLIVPLSADFTQADVQDNQMYSAITYPLQQGVSYMAPDCGYDDYKLYNLSITVALSWYVLYRKYTAILRVIDCS